MGPDAITHGRDREGVGEGQGGGLRGRHGIGQTHTSAEKPVNRGEEGARRVAHADPRKRMRKTKFEFLHVLSVPVGRRSTGCHAADGRGFEGSCSGV